MFNSLNFSVVLFLGATILCGCSNSSAPDYELAEVTGVVTLDGQPLEGAEVSYTPTGTGGMSLGTTDKSGKYELLLSPGVKGAAIGEHVVSIRKIGGPDTQYDTMNLLPEKYGNQSVLRANVEKGKANHFDFSLESNKKK